MLLSLLVLLSTACTSSTEYTLGYWHQRSDFDGKARAGAAFFNIDDIEYIVGGGNGKSQRLKSMGDTTANKHQAAGHDIGAYDTTSNTCKQTTQQCVLKKRIM